MAVQSLAQLSKLLAEAELDVSRLNGEYMYTGGNPTMLRSWLEEKSSPQDVYLVLFPIFM
eukprot:6364274-Amphidinium_carterae.1